jgi:enolase-phosphatase E1
VNIRLADRDVRLVLLDIEGTTTPIAFVHEVLFPFARARMAPWLRAHWKSADLATLVGMLIAEHQSEPERATLPPWHSATDAELAASTLGYLEWLMERDRKSPALKTLQGWIWEEGYQTGEIRGQVYPDVVPALQRWREAGVGVAIYSSGSELAQRRLFATVPEGDVTPLIAGFFDTAVGPKKAASSYTRIASALTVAPSSLLFISDVTSELAAARDAGGQVLLSVRPGNPPQHDASRFETLRTFDDLG